jgi:uncharacterized cupredoxin-like copper-binding protein
MQALQTRWRHLLGVFVLSVVLAACGGRTTQEHEVASRTPSDRPQQEDSAHDSETTLHVVATDFTFALDAAQVHAGTITFLATNEGRISHDFAIQGHGVDQKTIRVKPGHTAALTVDLQPGTYTYTCTVPGHALLGMKGTLTMPAGREHAAPQHLHGIRSASFSHC